VLVSGGVHAGAQLVGGRPQGFLEFVDHGGGGIAKGTGAGCPLCICVAGNPRSTREFCHGIAVASRHDQHRPCPRFFYHWLNFA
jgi:hypothetical protein